MWCSIPCRRPVLLIFSNYYAYIILLPLMVIPNNVAVYLAAPEALPGHRVSG